MDRLTEISYYQREFSSCRSFAAPISPIYSRFRQQHPNAGHHELHGNRFSSTPAFGGPVVQPRPPPWYTPSYPTFTGRTGLIRRGEDNYHPWPRWSEALPRPPRPPPPKPAKQHMDKAVMFKSSVMQDTYVVLLADRGVRDHSTTSVIVHQPLSNMVNVSSVSILCCMYIIGIHPC